MRYQQATRSRTRNTGSPRARKPKEQGTIDIRLHACCETTISLTTLTSSHRPLEALEQALMTISHRPVRTRAHIPMRLAPQNYQPPSSTRHAVTACQVWLT